MSQKYEYFGKYILLEKLASGGMAEVWLARAPGAGGIGKFVAIKKILPQYSDNPEFIQMFRDEAAIAMNLSHSNIVSIYEFGQEKQQLFLVLDYVEGRNLRQVLNKIKQNPENKISIEHIIYIAKEVAAGLDHAHRSLNNATGEPLNIIHRDMSPQNIMTSFEGEVKIIDFGIAKSENQMENTKTGTLKGKFGYMSPEQADGMVADLRTDIFSLGIVLWELLANERLFIANNEINTLKKIRDCHVPSLSKMNPNIDPEIERITNKALTRDRNLRYQTAASLHRDLNRFLNRQYPDFTPHDYGVFVKGLYADEILETRKRIIEYSKIPFSKELGKQSFGDDDKTLVTSVPLENSISVSESVSMPNHLDPSAEDITQTETFSESDNPDILGEVSNPNVLDLKALNKNNASTPEETTKPLDLQTSKTRTSHRHVPKSKGKKRPSKSSSSNVVSFAMAVASVLLIYVVLDMFFPQQTQQFQKLLRNRMSQVNSNPAEPQIVTENSSEQSEPTAAINSEKLPTGRRGLIVQSDPSGAEIYINDTNTGKQTPARINIPAHQEFKIRLRKARFIDYESGPLNAESIKASWTATLRKAQVAYISIDVRPARNALVYIDGKPLSENLPITGYSIPAYQSVTITAVNKLSGERVSEKVTLGEDQRKELILDLNTHRTPTGK